LWRIAATVAATPAWISIVVTTEHEIDALIHVVQHSHAFTAPASARAIERFEQRARLPMPADMRAFYLQCDGARLFGDQYILLDPDGMLPLIAVMPANAASARVLRGRWFSLGRTADGQWIGIDLEGATDDTNPVAVCISAGSPVESLKIIAPNFTSFLARALSGTRHPFWRHPRAH
jgi:cell wall assembly regulator SMI1